MPKKNNPLDTKYYKKASYFREKEKQEKQRRYRKRQPIFSFDFKFFGRFDD